MARVPPESSSDVEPDVERPRGALAELVETWGPALAAVILIRLFIFEPFRIPSGSMVPSLMIGDFVIVSKFSYGFWLPLKSIGIPFTNIGLPLENIELVDWGNPDRGDIAVFHYPGNENITYIKRIVAIPGDRIRVIDNQILLNGERLPHRVDGAYDDADARCISRPARHITTELPREDGTTLPYSVLTDARSRGALANHREVVVPDRHVFVMGDNRDHSEDSRAWGFVSYEQLKGKAHFVWMSWDACSGFPGSLRFDRMPASLYGPSKGP